MPNAQSMIGITESSINLVTLHTQHSILPISGSLLKLYSILVPHITLGSLAYVPSISPVSAQYQPSISPAYVPSMSQVSTENLNAQCNWPCCVVANPKSNLF